MTDEQVNQAIDRLDLTPVLNFIEVALEAKVGAKVGISLQVFSLGVQGTMRYGSNCRRKEMAEVLRELLDKWEADAIAGAPSAN